MSQVAAQASAFYREVSINKCLWTIKDNGGYPAPMTISGKRAQPFWSSENRANLIIKNSKAYNSSTVVKIEWEKFREKWAIGLEKDGILVGINWSGENATGYDVEPRTVVEYVERQMQ
jgi:hypothetical protein